MYNRPVTDDLLLSCPDCDLLQRLPQLEDGGSARCTRCNCELWRRRSDSLSRTLALALGAAILFVVANSVPMLGISVVGRSAATTVLGGALHLWSNGPATVGVLVLFTAVLAPALQISLTLAIVLGARRRRPALWVGGLLRYQPATRIWSMLEVMMLGVLVAITKIADYASVIPTEGLFALGLLIFVLAGMQAGFDPRDIWLRIQWINPEPAPAPEGTDSVR